VGALDEVDHIRDLIGQVLFTVNRPTFGCGLWLLAPAFRGPKLHELKSKG
jgi:hypothetical protein